MDENDSGWSPDRRPWFGPKRFGFGYGPQTWQGVLVTVVLVLLVAGTAAATGGHSPLMVVPSGGRPGAADHHPDPAPLIRDLPAPPAGP